MMLRSGLLALGLAACATAEAQAPLEPSHVLLELAGHCWQAELEAGVTDTHCFTVAVGGKLVMDTHKVRSLSGRVTYEGATLYRLDAAAGMVRYDYFNSNGDVLTGFAYRDGQAVHFPEKPGKTADLVWYLGTDAYEVGAAVAAQARRKFVKVGPAREGGL